jgi:energy-converting hydrogenase B subunit J
MIYIGPLVLGFILGFALGSRIKFDVGSKSKFSFGSYIVVLIVAIIMAYQIGPFPYYTDTRLASGFIAAILGIIIGEITFGLQKNKQINN